MTDGSDPFASAGARLRALRAGEISTNELLELHLARIARHNPALNAIVTLSSLPIGLQAIGPYLEDRTPIRFAALVAAELGISGCHIPPGYKE
jgi:Asp-tRNA(Asn)/Glu-tRNA(Gln) amidotransferase A subunit family amidase